MRLTCACLLALTLCACATTDPGWRGQGAEPFGQAESRCRQSVATLDADAREPAFQACMAEAGWHRD